MHGRKRRYAYVESSPARLRGEPSVLWRATFRKVQLSHDLQASHDRSTQGRSSRWEGDGLELPIDAHPDGQFPTPRFHVDVRGAFRGGPREQAFD